MKLKLYEIFEQDKIEREKKREKRRLEREMQEKIQKEKTENYLKELEIQAEIVYD